MKRYKVLYNTTLVGINVFAGDIIEVYSSQKWKVERLRMSSSHFVGDIVRYYPDYLVDVTHGDTGVSALEYKIRGMWQRQPYYKKFVDKKMNPC